MLDAQDKDILRALQQNGRRRLKHISKELGIPPSTVYSRMKRLNPEEAKELRKMYQERYWE